MSIKIQLPGAQILSVNPYTNKETHITTQYVEIATPSGDRINIGSPDVDWSKLPLMTPMNLVLDLQFYLYKNRTNLKLLGVAVAKA